MFKHTHKPNDATDSDDSQSKEKESEKIESAPVVEVKSLKDTSPAALRELLEKNLKWSQIIYEQNRRINSKLFWGAIGSWFRIILFFAVLTGSALFLSPFFKQFIDVYNSFARQAAVGPISPTSSIESVLKFLPLDTAQKDQLKTFLK